MAYKAIGDMVRAMREAKGTLREIDQITGVPGSRISEIENGRAYLGPYAGALAKALGTELFTLVIREGEMRGLRPAAEVAVGMLIAHAGMTGGFGTDEELRAAHLAHILTLDYAAILSEDAVLVELDKHWSRPAIKAGYGGLPQLSESELEIVREVIAEELAELTEMQAKIRAATT